MTRTAGPAPMPAALDRCRHREPAPVGVDSAAFAVSFAAGGSRGSANYSAGTASRIVFAVTVGS